MVAICVGTLGHQPVECNARPMFFRAGQSLERRDLIAAGCELREAVRRWLHAECEYHECMPKPRKGPSTTLAPRALAKALKKKGLTGSAFDLVMEIIEIGNKAAHLAFVTPREISTAIAVSRLLLDGSPYLVESTAGGQE